MESYSYNLSRLAFFTRHEEEPSRLCVSVVPLLFFFFFLLSPASRYSCTTVRVTIRTLRNTVTVSGFGLVWIKRLCTFVERVYVNISFTSLQLISKNAIAGSCGNCSLNVKRNRNSCRVASCTILHSCLQCMRDPVSPHPRRYLVLLFYIALAILTGV